MVEQNPKVLEVCLRACRELAAPGEINEKLGLVVNQAAAVLQADWVSLIIIDPNQSQIAEAVCCGSSADGGYPLDVERIILLNCAPTPAPRPGQSDHLIAIERFDRLFNCDTAPGEKKYRGLAEPMIVQGQLLGVMCAARQAKRPPLKKQAWQLLALIASQAGMAIHNARLIELNKIQRKKQAAINVENACIYRAAREATIRREVLHQVCQQIVAAGLYPEGIYATIHKAVSRMMPAEAFVITENDESNDQVRNSYLIDRNGWTQSVKLQADEGLSGKVIKTGRPVYIPDEREDPDRGHYLYYDQEERVRSILAVPMRLRGKVIGMLSAQSYQPGAYTPEDQALLEMLAPYAAIALENAHLFAHIQQLAITDPVTGIANRRHLFDLGKQEFVRARRFKRTLSVIMMDIDHFKLVNDRFGHATGDDVLLKLAQLIRSEIREVDIVGRYGGEEFTVILPETSLAAALEVAERLRQKINQTFYPDDSGLSRVTVSIGVAENLRIAADFPTLVHLADQALYAAKAAGRDRVKAYDPRQPQISDRSL